MAFWEDGMFARARKHASSCQRVSSSIMENDSGFNPKKDLRKHNAVAGHDGVMESEDGSLFIKPVKEDELRFYQSCQAEEHDEFRSIMPTFLGVLTRGDQTTQAAVAQVLVISDPSSQDVTPTKDSSSQETLLTEPTSQGSPVLSSCDSDMSATSKKDTSIETNTAVVLGNTAHGMKQPNIMDCKMGFQLWSKGVKDTKKKRCIDIAENTTHQTKRFRIAGMRVWHDPANLDLLIEEHRAICRGNDTSEQLDAHIADFADKFDKNVGKTCEKRFQDLLKVNDEGYLLYDRNYGRDAVRDWSLMPTIEKFVFNEDAGISRELGIAVCGAFVNELDHIIEVLQRANLRMFSGSLLFTFEGDGRELERKIAEHARLCEEEEEAKTKSAAPATAMTKTDTDADGPEEDEDEENDEEDAEDAAYARLKNMVSVHLIDFAHAEWVGKDEGPDRDLVQGAKSLRSIFLDIIEKKEQEAEEEVEHPPKKARK